MSTAKKITIRAIRPTFFSLVKLILLGTFLFWAVGSLLGLMIVLIQPQYITINKGMSTPSLIKNILCTIILAPVFSVIMLGIPTFVGLCIFNVFGEMNLTFVCKEPKVSENQQKMP
jgi:hypothetical protein